MVRLFLSLVPLVSSLVFGQSFRVDGNSFLLNGKPFQILSGEMHYPRIPHEYWGDRLRKARAMGLNTICTNVFWNIHEQQEGTFDFSGDLDVAGFVRLAQQAGLCVILRPGPYICAEWDFGGLPAWLLKDPDIRVRCTNARYLEAAKKYLLALAGQLRDLQVTHGGPIIMVQLENEYGSFGSDKEYLRTLRQILRSAGFDVPLYTSDGPSRELLLAGTLDSVPPVINFDGDPQRYFPVLESFRPGTPPMTGEFWVGWFTHWGDQKWGRQDDARQLKDIEWIVSGGKSINLYMLHGGTNFGFWSGANVSAHYEPTVTSYDYDAPIDESGRPRQKYFELREILKKAQSSGAILPELPASLPVIDIPIISVSETAPLFSNLPSPIPSMLPRPMEYYDQGYGYILYRTHLIGRKHGTLKVPGLHDFASVYMNGKFVGVLDRMRNQFSLEIPLPDSDNSTLDILVEAYGRVNFGPNLIDRKGITEYASIGESTLMNWEVYPLPLDERYIASLQFHRDDGSVVPRFFRGSFHLDATGDTFLDMRGWNQGVVWINGHNLGRYWNLGPQHDLFVPGVWLKSDENSLLIFDPGQLHPASLKASRERIRP